MPVHPPRSDDRGFIARRRVCWAAVAAPLLGLVALSGCENTIEYSRYPKDLEYPVRTDLIVPSDAKLPPDQPPYPPPPGDLDGEIALFASRAKAASGKEVALDPNRLLIKKDDGTTEDQTPKLMAERKLLQVSLQKVFGTPRQPAVGYAKGESKDLTDQLTKLKLRDAEADFPFRTLSHGSRVYRYHCVHCHGLTGDGRGPTGPWIEPHPRDYRSGLFKFITSADVGKGKPRRDDLVRVLHNGVENTTMPSFALLDVREPESQEKETDLEAVASYVMHLSIRGEVEIKLFNAMIAEGTEYQDQEHMDKAVHEAMADVVGAWARADEKALEPEEGAYVENLPHAARDRAIQHGFEIFTTNDKAGCIKCHLDYGRQAPFRYDRWGTMVRPMNLTTGVYRGGRRPIDLYWRIKGGIVPSGMADAASLPDKDVWDLVRFVQALPYPAMLPDDVRDKVYGRPDDAAKAERAEK